VKIFGVMIAAISAFVAADILTHPAGTQAAGSAISTLWKTTAQGASGQTIS
jgi:hypothetical protein